MSHGATILVVDDEPAILRFLRTSLKGQGFDVIEAASGAEALEQVRNAKPELVVLDLGLPDLDGFEVIRRIRAGSSLPIVVLTVRAGERDKVEALDLGADDYVTKPFGIGELLARVRTALRHRLHADGAPAVYQHDGLEVDRVRRHVAAGIRGRGAGAGSGGLREADRISRSEGQSLACAGDGRHGGGRRNGGPRR